ncbi:uncharacterized protein [Narcine bancroftii]|uniref:uncharacterized protein n=1 Tax=Narcine bancroftii TaxID=1343680 RepID=UPI003831BF95
MTSGFAPSSPTETVSWKQTGGLAWRRRWKRPWGSARGGGSETPRGGPERHKGPPPPGPSHERSINTTAASVGGQREGNGVAQPAKEKMLGSRLTLLHLLALLVSMQWGDGTTPDTESSDLFPWPKAVQTAASVGGTGLDTSGRLQHNHLAGLDAGEQRRKRSSIRSAPGFNRRLPKPRGFQPKPRKIPKAQRRQLNFPIDRIGRSYLPKIRH